MLKLLRAVTLLAVLAPTDVSPSALYDFVPLQEGVSEGFWYGTSGYTSGYGGALSTWPDITNDGAVLIGRDLYKGGEVFERLTYERPIAPTGINSSHTIVGSYNFSDGGVPEYPTDYGFIAEKNGEMKSLDLFYPYGISDNGTMVGFVSFIIAGAPVLVKPNAMDFAHSEYPTELYPYGLPYRINNRGHILIGAGYFVGPLWRTTFWDGTITTTLNEDLTSLAFADLNNRGEMVGWSMEWLDSDMREGTRSVSRGFLRDQDGTFHPIEWAYPWPLSLSRFKSGENVTLYLVRALGTQVYGLNDAGSVVAGVGAYYEGVLSDGAQVKEIERVVGVGTQAKGTP